MTLVLHDWGPSPFCLKIRVILDYKGIPYERRRVGPSGLARVLRRGGTGKVPALELDDALITDSTDIALALEERWPSPPILPDDPELRARCLALEDWSDEALYWLGIHHQWVDPEGLAMVPAAFGGSLPGRLTAKVYERMIKAQLLGQGIGRKRGEHVRRDLDRVLDAIAGMLADREWLIDARPSLADFAIAGQMVYLSHTPGGGRALEARPTILAHRDRVLALRTAR